MTANPLEDALRALRREIRRAEEHLASLDAADFGDRFAAAGEVAAARLRASEVESALPAASARMRTEVGVEALAALLGDEPGAEEGPL